MSWAIYREVENKKEWLANLLIGINRQLFMNKKMPTWTNKNIYKSPCIKS